MSAKTNMIKSMETKLESMQRDMLEMMATLKELRSDGKSTELKIQTIFDPIEISSDSDTDVPPPSPMTLTLDSFGDMALEEELDTTTVSTHLKRLKKSTFVNRPVKSVKRVIEDQSSDEDEEIPESGNGDSDEEVISRPTQEKVIPWLVNKRKTEALRRGTRNRVVNMESYETRYNMLLAQFGYQGNKIPALIKVLKEYMVVDLIEINHWTRVCKGQCSACGMKRTLTMFYTVSYNGVKENFAVGPECHKILKEVVKMTSLIRGMKANNETEPYRFAFTKAAAKATENREDMVRRYKKRGTIFQQDDYSE